jgi:hypothetical protein
MDTLRSLRNILAIFAVNGFLNPQRLQQVGGHNSE